MCIQSANQNPSWVSNIDFYSMRNSEQKNKHSMKKNGNAQKCLDHFNRLIELLLSISTVENQDGLEAVSL